MTEVIRTTIQDQLEDYEKFVIDLLKKEFETPRDVENPNVEWNNVHEYIHSQLKQTPTYEQDPKIHLSDLIHCPRQSYFKIILGVTHNERTLSYFFDGKAMHLMLQYLFDKYYPGRFTMENRTKVNDLLTFTPDIIDLEKNTIIEFKTARSPVINDAPRTDHVEQLKAYMAFTRIYNGVVLYHLITKEQENLFTAHRIQITPLEADIIRRTWLKEAESLQNAIKHNDKQLARHIADDYGKNWMCNGYCDYTQFCDEGKAAIERIIARRMEAKELRLASRKSKIF
jgi:hypothetical protein